MSILDAVFDFDPERYRIFYDSESRISLIVKNKSDLNQDFMLLAEDNEYSGKIFSESKERIMYAKQLHCKSMCLYHANKETVESKNKKTLLLEQRTRYANITKRFIKVIDCQKIIQVELYEEIGLGYLLYEGNHYFFPLKYKNSPENFGEIVLKAISG